MNATPLPTFRALFVRAFGMGMIVFLCAASYLVSTTFAPPVLDFNDDSQDVMSIRESISSTQTDVMQNSGCVYAQGELPTGAVVDPAGDTSWVYTTSSGVITKAFEQLIFDGVLEANEFTKAVDHGMRVGAFCK